MTHTVTQTISSQSEPVITLRLQITVFIFAFLVLLADGADLIFLSFSYSSLASEFGLSKTQLGSLATFTLIGVGTGSAFGGWLADRFGRVNTIAWSVILFSIGTACLAFTHSYAAFATVRLISSFGLGAVYLTTNTLMAEYVSSKHRTTVLALMQSGWTVGYILATLLSGWIIPEYGWRPLFFICVFPVIIAILMKRLIPETPIWSAQTTDIANNKKSQPKAIQTSTITNKVKKKSALRILYDNKPIFRTFLAWTFIAAFFQFGYYGVNTWLPSYLELEMNMDFRKMASYMFGTYTVMILGKIIAGVLADRLGTRAIYALSSLAIAAFIPVIIFWHTPENILYLMLFFGFLYGMPSGVLGTYMTESFPVNIRGSATAWSFNTGRIFSALAPILIGIIATHMGLGISFLALAVAYILTGSIAGIFVKSKLYDTNRE